MASLVGLMVTGSGLAQPAPVATRNLPLGKRLAYAGQAATKGRAQAHREAIERTGVGLYHGSDSSFEKLDLAARQKWIDARKKPGTEPRLTERTSCIDWALECVQTAYREVGRPGDAATIAREVGRGGGRGTVLLRELIARGWVGVYWNPDALKPSDGESEHTYSNLIARTSRRYYGLEVRQFLRNYRPSTGSTTPMDTSGLEQLRQVPFWVGIARGGRHCFVGYEGTLSEVHWGYQPDSKSLIEESPFEKFSWCSGMIVVPPGTWPKKVPGITATLR